MITQVIMRLFPQNDDELFTFPDGNSKLINVHYVDFIQEIVNRPYDECFPVGKIVGYLDDGSNFFLGDFKFEDNQWFCMFISDEFIMEV